MCYPHCQVSYQQNVSIYEIPTYEKNMISYEIAQKRGIPCIGGSDSHSLENIGKYATHFRKNIDNVQDIIYALKKKEVFPVFFNKRSQKFEKI